MAFLPARAAAEPVRSFLADLPDETRNALSEIEGPPVTDLDPRGQLEALFQAVPPYSFDAGVVVAYGDSRWFSTQSPGGEGAPILELRRWPGDTVLALYALAGPFGVDRPGGPPVAGAELELQPQTIAERAEWSGTLETDAGERSIIWIEIDIPGEDADLGALLIPGDAGLGASGVEDLTTELRVMLDRVRLVPEAWQRVEGVAAGVSLAVPLLGCTPGHKKESEAPWQVARATGFTVGLPPGFRARRTDGSIPPPVEVPGGLLWFRGRFEDIEGIAVAVGDGRRAAYIAEVSPLRQTWMAGNEPPVGAPGAKSKARQPFPLAAERARADSASAERWKEPGFSGDWLLFRLAFADRGVEIGLPVLEGRRSASLYWIAATWRPADRPPAPPPVDPAERFGIRFERLRPTERVRQPWIEGYLQVPGLRAEIPKGWFPAASLRSSDGYPIRILDGDGITRGIITRLAPGTLPSFEDESEAWQAIRKPAVHRAEQVYVSGSGSYCYLSKAGHAFLLEPVAVDGADEGELWRLLVQSVLLQRSSR